MTNNDSPTPAVNAEAIKTLKESDTRQWASIQKIQNRPPVWATAAISLLTFSLGCSLTYAGLVIRLASN